jgi:hypothetical protein
LRSRPRFPTLNPKNAKKLEDDVFASNARCSVKLAFDEVRLCLMQCARSDPVSEKRHHAAADILLFYRNTDNFVKACGFRSFMSSPVAV